MAKFVNSINSFANTLSKNKVKGNHNKIINDALFANNGTGSFILDFLTRGKISKSSKYQSFQRKLSDVDMKLGGKAYDFFDNRKSKRLNSLKKSFIQEHDILKNKGKNGLADEYIKIKRSGLTTPLNKTKDSVLPMVGSMTIASKIFDDKEQENLNEHNQSKVGYYGK